MADSEELRLWSVQTVYGSRPWAVEMPSAGRPLSFQILLGLRKKGVELCWLTHAAGLSSTGDPALDAALPLPERYEIPDTTVAAIGRARRRGGRIIAVGTTVARALEGAAGSARAAGAQPGTLFSGRGTTDLVIGAQTELAVVNGILSGMHGPGESHFRLLSAFAPPPLLTAAWEHAGMKGYLCHEFGDLCLLAPSILEQPAAVSALPAPLRNPR
jgi:S-adenosylmethionine:tRNA ribosyltransferase-isomerase